MLARVIKGVSASTSKVRALMGLEISSKIPRVGPAWRELNREWEPSGHTLKDMELVTGGIVSDIAFDGAATQWTGLGHQDLATPCDNAIVRECTFTSRHNWASRSYRMRKNNAMEGVAFFDTPLEHDIYWNLAGGRSPVCCAFNHIYSENCAGQVIQLVQRAKDWYGVTPPEDLLDGGWIYVDRLVAVNPGSSFPYGGARAGFSLSFFKSKMDLSLTRVIVDKTMQPASSGCLLIEDRKRVVIDRLSCITNDTRQPIIQVENVTNFRATNCFFHANTGQNWLSFHNTMPRLIDCSGETRVHIDGMDRGSVTEYSRRMG